MMRAAFSVILLAGFAGLLNLTACSRNSSSTNVAMTLHVTPDPPAVGSVDVEVRAADAAGTPMIGGTLKVEGNMNHAGMKPTFGELAESKPGVYRGPLELTMGGDWVITVDASFPDGTKASQTFDLRGVRVP